ncbi:TraX family protein [Bifidobacterium choloepi]|uniref:ABC transporter permease n=1 Tax=Bifidobacterium choloepi TaxID=2614131 RepID=A0A6I5N9T0_9BIFI|nr:TraX family protein [Bifidobacterium choloepi]NEG70551.1 ABC transporter permease [Bifidobacterium choloepi]
MDEYTRSLEEKARRKADAACTGRRGWSHTKLKAIAYVLLGIGVASNTLVPALFGQPTEDNFSALTMSVVCTAIGWVAIPMFAWFLYSGFKYTHNVLYYWLRLVLLAVICEVPYDMINYGQPIDWQSQNPVWALVIALSALILVHSFRQYSRPVEICLTVIVLLVAVVWTMVFKVGVTESLMMTGLLVLGTTMIFYYLDGRENLMMGTAGVFSAMFLAVPAVGIVLLHFRRENDVIDRPKHRWTHYLGYVVYPAMLLFGMLVAM